METKTLREQQIEALSEVYKYLQKLLPAAESIVKELREAKQADTDELLGSIINGLNWIIEVLNRTLDIINEEEIIIEKERINAFINNLGNALREKDDLKISDSFEKDIIPFLLLLNGRLEKITKFFS